MPIHAIKGRFQSIYDSHPTQHAETTRLTTCAEYFKISLTMNRPLDLSNMGVGGGGPGVRSKSRAASCPKTRGGTGELCIPRLTMARLSPLKRLRRRAACNQYRPPPTSAKLHFGPGTGSGPLSFLLLGVGDVMEVPAALLLGQPST